MSPTPPTKTEISIEQLATWLSPVSNQCTPYVLDIRDDLSWQRSHIDHPAVHHVPLAMLDAHLDKLPHNRAIPVLCYTGATSKRVVAFLCSLGFQAYNVKGGMSAWVNQVDPNLPQP